MGEGQWFEGVNPVAAMGAEDLMKYLRDLDDPEVEAIGTQRVAEGRFSVPWKTKPYEYAGSQVGYLQASGAGPMAIVDPRAFGPQMDLLGRTVTIQITQALVHSYPGRGRHEILLRFEAGGRQPGAARHRFSVKTDAEDGDRPAVQGQVLFSGLPVGADGISVQMNSINIHSSDDCRLAGALQSKVLHCGLDLASGALGPASGLFEAAIETVADYVSKRAENKAVQAGLVAAGFERNVPDTFKLREGTYVLVQAPADLDGAVWSWDRYVFDPATGAIVKSAARAQSIGFNYVALAITADR